MTPGQIKALIYVLLAAGAIAGGYFAVTAYNGAITAKERLQTQVKQLEQAAKEQRETIAKLEAGRKADADALAEKTAENKAYADLLAGTIKDYRNDLKKLSELERACAGRPVPGAVDRLLDTSKRR